MDVTAISGTTLTVTRGYDGTTAQTTINSGANVPALPAIMFILYQLLRLPASRR
jgi:hypothetical protein